MDHRITLGRLVPRYRPWTRRDRRVPRQRSAEDRVLVREVRPGEDALVDAVFDGMSARSRYLRFHGVTPWLRPVVRRRLADVDGHRHVAFVALAGGRPIGLGRCLALGDGRAELAVGVVDDWHGVGVGTLLVRAVADRATALGCTALVAEVLAENGAMLAVLRREFPWHRAVRAGDELTLTLPLVALGSDEPGELVTGRPPSG